MQIYIVKFNQPKFEEECIESVKKHTDLNKHTLTVYDNYPLKENLAVVWNRLIENSKHENICLLNNDTLVEEGWTRMEEVLKDSEVGAVGPVTNNCGGKQKNMPKNGQVEEINDLSGFCYCFRKEVWEDVGRFPEDMPFYGQETVFNRKLEDRGYKLMVDRRVYVHHYKGQSWQKARDAGEISDNNREYARMHYYNFIARLKKVQKLPRNVVILGAGKGNPFPTFQGIDQFVSDFGGVHLPMDATVDEIGEPEVLIVVQTRYKQEWFNTIKNCRAKKKILYFMDLRVPGDEELDWKCEELNFFDKVFICAKEFIPQWENKYKIPFEWLSQATIQQPIPPEGEQHNIVHIGGLDHSFHKNRVEMIAELPPLTQINEFDRDKRAGVVKRMWGIYGSSDFSLAISPKVEGYISDRVYHIMGSGGCLLSFDPGGMEHLKEYGLWFKTVDEAKKLLETPKEERDKIKKKAFDYVQSNHLYKDRLIFMLENV